MKKLTLSIAVLVFSLVFATSGYAAGMLGANNGMGMSSSTSDNTGSGSVLGGNRGMGANNAGATGMGMSGTSAYSNGLSTPPPSGIYPRDYGYGTSRSMSTPSTYGGTSSTSYNTNGTMRGYNYRTAAADTDDNNWGWMGLLGLLGLIGLRRTNENKHREHTGGKH